MSASHLNRNLLFVILAFRMDLIDRPGLLTAMRTWLQGNRNGPIEEILVEYGLLSIEGCQLLAPLVAQHIDNHQGDPQESLASLSSIGSVAHDLESLGDPQLAVTLSFVQSHDGPHDETISTDSVPRAVDKPTSGGLRYQLLRPHAKGGLGEVSVAKDRELNREVALKLIQAKFADDKGSRDRFVLEAEVTGGLEHPGIVPVYGLGQYADGRPFYAMRFIRGASLQQAADRFHQGAERASAERHTSEEPAQQRPTGEPHQIDATTRNEPTRASRQATAKPPSESGVLGKPLLSVSFESVAFRNLLGRFVDVCNAIAYAHSRGVLHRDLKPGNIMLGKYGETLVVDWGMAKVQGFSDEPESKEGESLLRPQSGSNIAPTAMGSVMGTPVYMPPEQATGRLDDLGPASDVYSLGATLYYLLTGRTPIEGKTFEEILKKVQMGDFPSPRRIQSATPKPLESICLRAMALQPQDRYASAKALADDVERYLADEPVRAHSDPLSIRARRWMRKHPKSVASLAATLLIGLTSTLAIVVIVSGKNQQLADANTELDHANAQLTSKNVELKAANQAEQQARKETEKKRLEAEQARKEAETRRQESETVLAFFQNNVLATARPKGQEGGLGIDVTIRAAVDAAEPTIAGSFTDKPLVEAALRSTLGLTYLYLGETELAIRQHERARQLYESKMGREHPDTLTSMNNLATAYADAGRLDEAVKLHEETLKLRKKKLGQDHPNTLMSMGNLAVAYMETDRLDKALPLLEKTFEAFHRKQGKDHPDTLTSMNNLARAYDDGGRLEEALPLFEEALKISKKQLGPDHPKTLAVMNNLARAYEDGGRFEEALPLFEETLKISKKQLGPDHPKTLAVMHNLANAYYDSGRLKEALPIFEEALKRRKQRLGPDHLDTLTSMHKLARVYDDSGRLKEALPLFEETLKISKKQLGPDHSDTLVFMNNLARAYDDSGRLEEALPIFEETLKRRTQKQGPDHPDTLLSMSNLARAYEDTGRLEEALHLYEETVKLMKKRLGPEHAETLTAMNGLGSVYWKAGRLDDALSVLEETLTLRTKTLGTEHPDTIGSMNNLATVYQAVGRLDAALPLFEETLELMKQKLGPNHPDTLLLMGNLAYAYQIAGRLTKALQLAEETFTLRKSQLGLEHPDTLRSMANFALACLAAKQPKKALPLFEGFIVGQRKLAKPDRLKFARLLEQVARDLLKYEQYSAAESYLRECLKIREKTMGNDWICFNTQCMLGRALTGEGHALLATDKHAAIKFFTEAEPLLVSGYEGMKALEAAIPENKQVHLSEGLQDLLVLYKAWDKPKQVARWQAEFDKRNKEPKTNAAEPASPTKQSGQ